MSVDASNDLWDCTAYDCAQPDVRQRCRRLQDEHGRDVDLPLAASRATSENIAFSVQTAPHLDEAARTLREPFTKKIRALRRTDIPAHRRAGPSVICYARPDRLRRITTDCPVH